MNHSTNISYKSPITHISLHSFDDLSQKVAELETLLSVVNLGDIDQTASYLISAAERLANWLQADVKALHKAYGEQHGWYSIDTATSQSNEDNVGESA